jgi:predicted permease
MQIAGPGGLFIFIACVTSGLILFILWRMTRRPVAEARFAAALGGEPPR